MIGNACNIQMFIQSWNGTMFIILTFLTFNLNIKCDNMHKGNDLKTKEEEEEQQQQQNVTSYQLK